MHMHVLTLCYCRLGKIDPRPGYHSRTQLWPVGYQATWKDLTVGTFEIYIVENEDDENEGPKFAASLLGPHEQRQVRSNIFSPLTFLHHQTIHIAEVEREEKLPWNQLQ